MYDTTTITVQAKALLKALRQSYGIHVSPSTGTAAKSLAPQAREIRPAVWLVGRSIVDLWRGPACSCQQARQTKHAGQSLATHPCPHLTALYLAGIWSPAFNPADAYAAAGINKPKILACYATFRRRGYPATSGWRIESSTLPKPNNQYILSNITTGITQLASWNEITNLVPFYE